MSRGRPLLLEGGPEPDDARGDGTRIGQRAEVAQRQVFYRPPLRGGVLCLRVVRRRQVEVGDAAPRPAGRRDGLLEEVEAARLHLGKEFATTVGVRHERPHQRIRSEENTYALQSLM